ncbi:nibrin [Entomortierella parvispora]|uniref:Nibrin n=1 Tax=Entomortierella parvispora TaxID=205924 RepID=A0A9P3H583_9FUNG|nr:nibrin [Entomortierella parvispora]
MWFLVGLGLNEGLRIWLKPDSKLTIGRAEGADIVRLGANDSTVSRRHVAITIGKPTLESVRVQNEHTELTIQDLGSARGVILDGIQIEKAKEIKVEIKENQTWAHEDKRHIAGKGYGGWATIEIGDSTLFRLERVDISLCSSGMARQAKLSIIESAVEIDAKVDSTAWIPGVSTHLIIGNNKLTEKMYMALAEGGYLVDASWLKDMATSLETSWSSRGQNFTPALETRYPAPVPVDFRDASIQWEPHFSRRTVFSGYRFISFQETFNKSVGQLVQCGGGIWSIEDPARAGTVITRCMSETLIPVCLVPAGGEDPGQTFPKAETVLKKLGYRWVEEDEIGKAIIYASTDIFCNPKHMGPLPTHEEMSTLHVSQMPFTQNLGSLASMPAFMPQPKLRKGNSADFPQVIDDGDDDDDIWILPSKKTGSSKPKTTSPAPAKASTEKPPKKKSKMDRMAMFFDGLDDDDIVDLDPPGTPVTHAIAQDPSLLHIPTPAKTARNSSSLVTPVPVAWPELIDLDAESSDSGEPGFARDGQTQKVDFTRDGQTQKVDFTRDGQTQKVEFTRDGQTQKVLSEDEEDYTPTVDEDPKHTTDKLSKPQLVVKKEADQKPDISLKQMEHRSKSGKTSKHTTFEAIRGDMEGLKLDVKISRQKENIDEQQKLLRVGAHHQRGAITEGGESNLMQSERSDQLLAKNKRRKVLELASQSQGQIESLSSADVDSVSQNLGRGDRSASVHILEEADRKDWPQRWKEKPNFKTRAAVDPILEAKWKDRPNFKTFCKSTLPGVHSQPSAPLPLTLDGKIVEKHEETIEKIGNYFKREADTAVAPKTRKKPSEKQMARDDIKVLLAE